MATNDVLNSISEHVAIFWSRTFDEVPESPGVYAWYYPLRIHSLSIDDLIAEINSVFYFDGAINGPLGGSAHIDLCWRRLGVDVNESPRHSRLPEHLSSTWSELLKDQDGAKFLRFRQSLLASSILLPPLYVGKANNLHTRCHQHIRGAHESGFRSRFECYAKEHDLHSAVVNSLLFACIRLDEEDFIEPGACSDELPRLLEAILQIGARPPFGKRL